jgi:hypothetical protein
MERFNEPNGIKDQLQDKVFNSVSVLPAIKRFYTKERLSKSGLASLF